MLVELRGRGDRRHRLLIQATVPTLIILLTTVSCSRLDMRQSRVGTAEPVPWFPIRMIEPANPQLVQRGEGQPKARREQPRTSASSKVAASPKVATVHMPKAPNASGSQRASKKPNTPPRPDAQREEQLFQEFLEWRRRQRELP